MEPIQKIHPQKEQLIPVYIFISASFRLSLYSWIAGLDEDEQWSELFVLRVYYRAITSNDNGYQSS